MAKIRIRKKGECTHYYLGESFLVTDDPYPIYNNELYCKLGKFDWTWGCHDNEELPCKKCKKFKLSRVKQRKQRQEEKEFEIEYRIYKRYESKYPQENVKKYNNIIDGLLPF